jgi:lipoic acid synthetase
LVSKPDWLKKRIILNNSNIKQIKNLIENFNLSTVCQSAKCPNIFECFSNKTATFMLMGEICTRNCGFCGVKSGKPEKLLRDEPYRIAKAVKEAKLRYAVITSVTRDDLSDGGSHHFAETVRAVKKLNPRSGIECLIPDFRGDRESLKTVIDEDLTVLGHNIETIRDNYKMVRRNSSYETSLDILRTAKKIRPDIYVKSGFMLGLGEDRKGIRQLLTDIKEAGCDIVTIGQYLRPSISNLPVRKYYRPEEFAEIKEIAEGFDFKSVESGVFVRSSYHAELVMEEILKNENERKNSRKKGRYIN